MNKQELLERIVALEARVKQLEERGGITTCPIDPNHNYHYTGLHFPA